MNLKAPPPPPFPLLTRFCSWTGYKYSAQRESVKGGGGVGGGGGGGNGLELQGSLTGRAWKARPKARVV